MVSCAPITSRRGLSGNRMWDFSITLSEGRNREVRRLCEAIGLEVHRLVRTHFGPLDLGAMPSGTVRPLTSRERKLLEALVKPAAKPTG